MASGKDVKNTLKTRLAGHSPDFGKTLCGKLSGLNTPLSDQLDQSCPTSRHRLLAGCGGRIATVADMDEAG